MSAYIPIIFLFIILFMVLRTGKAVVARKVIQRRKKEDLTKMVELAERFIGKECLIYAFDSSHTFQGIVREVSDGAVLIENGGNYGFFLQNTKDIFTADDATIAAFTGTLTNSTYLPSTLSETEVPIK